MAELDTIYAILAAQAVGMLLTTAVYSFLRLRKEERKVRAAEIAAAANKASFDAMTVYHAKRLEIEEQKLELARKNGKSETKATLQRGGLVTEQEPAVQMSEAETPEELAKRWDRDGREQKALEQHVAEIREENRTKYAYEEDGGAQ